MFKTLWCVLVVALAPPAAWAAENVRLHEGAAAHAPSPSLSVGIWSEFLDFALVERYLPELKRQGASLYLGVTEAALDNEDFYHLWAAAARAGVPIRPWILLRFEQGYWANKWNYPQIEALVWKTLWKLESRGLATTWITLDFEPPPQYLQQLAENFAKSDYVALWRQLRKSSKQGSIVEAERNYGSLVGKLHARGIRVHAVTTPLVLHDMKSQKQKVQSALGVPIQNIAWDEITFMSYRTEFAKILGKASPDIVYEYGKRARRYFGTRAGLDLGEAGDATFPTPTKGYHDPLELWRDEAAAQAAGIERLNIYSLDGLAMLHTPGTGAIEPWLAVPPAIKPLRDSNTHFYLWLIDMFVGLLPRGR